MGLHQFVVSIDKTYMPKLSEIARLDNTYLNPKSKESNKKRICQDAINLLHFVKTKNVKIIILGKVEGTVSDEEIESVRDILSGKR